MIIAEPIKQTGYIRARDYRLMRSGDANSCVLKSRPPVDERNQEIYKATHGVRIHVNPTSKVDLEQLKALYFKLHGEPYTYGRMGLYDIVSSIIGEHNIYCVFGTDDRYSISLSESPYANNSWDCIVYTKDSFDLVPLTKGEEQKILNIETAKTKAKFNNLVAKDIILQALNENQFGIYVVDDRYLNFKAVKGWNKLVKEAIEYYLNNAILKDTGCKIKTPKVKSNHKYCYYDYLCDLGEVDVELKE